MMPVLFILNAAAAAYNAGSFAANGSPLSLGVAVFAGLVAIALAVTA